MTVVTLPGQKDTRVRRRLGAGRRSSRPRAIPPVRGLLPIVAVLVVWLVIGSSDSFYYPKPTTWPDSLREMHQDGLLLPAVAHTLRTFFLGLLLATLAGLVFGALIGASRTVDRALTPVMDFFRALPPPAVVSVILLVMGPNYSAALLMVAIGGTWPILLNTVASMKAVPAIRTDVSRTLNLSRLEHIRKVLLPSLVPGVLLGVRVSASIAFVVTLFIEILRVTQGLGFLLATREERFDAAGVWGLLLVVGICGYLINVGVALLGRRLLKGWPTAG